MKWKQNGESEILLIEHDEIVTNKQMYSIHVSAQ